MKIRISTFRKVVLAILLTGFILSASSCASSKASARRRMIESEQSYTLAINNGLVGNGQPERVQLNWAKNREGMKGPYKPKQENYQQNARSQGGDDHDNGFGNAIGGIIMWLLNGLFGSR